MLHAKFVRDNKYFALLKQSLDSTYLNFLANVIEKATDFEVRYFSQVEDNSRRHLHDQSLKHAKNEVSCDFTRVVMAWICTYSFCEHIYTSFNGPP